MRGRAATFRTLSSACVLAGLLLAAQAITDKETAAATNAPATSVDTYVLALPTRGEEWLQSVFWLLLLAGLLMLAAVQIFSLWMLPGLKRKLGGRDRGLDDEIAALSQSAEAARADLATIRLGIRERKEATTAGVSAMASQPPEPRPAFAHPVSVSGAEEWREASYARPAVAYTPPIEKEINRSILADYLAAERLDHPGAVEDFNAKYLPSHVSITNADAVRSNPSVALSFTAESRGRLFIAQCQGTFWCFPKFGCDPIGERGLLQLVFHYPQPTGALRLSKAAIVNGGNDEWTLAEQGSFETDV